VPTDHWYFFTGIDVLGDSSSAAVVVLGDSITDGRGSTTNGNDRWPDNLAGRLQANPATAGVAVLNQGVGGNAVLRGGLGPTALERFERDVVDQSSVRWLIVLDGVNDIGASRDASVEPRHEWHRDCFLPLEQYRGLDTSEDHLLAGIFHFELQPGQSATIVLSTIPSVELDGIKSLAARNKLEDSILANWNEANRLLASSTPGWAGSTSICRWPPSRPRSAAR